MIAYEHPAPERETCSSIILMLAVSIAFVIVVAGDALWQYARRLWKRERGER